jgi:hypothetical protein
MMYSSAQLACAAGATDPFQAALAYQEFGFSVLPLRGKRPGLSSWRRYQQQRASQGLIRQWHDKGLFGNVGLVCGRVSGGLVALDFDGPAGHPAFAATFPRLADTFTVATGSGVGKHVYLIAERLPPTTKAMDTPIGHLELRADGCLIVAAPSIHPDTQQPYRIDRRGGILRVPALDAVAAWIESFSPNRGGDTDWQPPDDSPTGDADINPDLIRAIARELERRGAKHRKGWLNVSCIYPERHRNGDKHPSFGFNTASGYGFCHRCGSILARDICERLGIDPRTYGGLVRKTETTPARSRKKRAARPSATPAAPSPPGPPAGGDDDLPDFRGIALPDWLAEYVSWASRVGNQTPVMFHQGAGIWAAATAIARRVYVSAPWGVKIYPNLYVMFVAATTYYRKTTAYKLAEQMINRAIPHMLMPTPGSPERFWDALAGLAPSNFKDLPQHQQAVVMDGMKFAAQRGLFKDEIAGLFGSFKRDYMAGLKDDLLHVYDCPDFEAKETQSGLRIITNAALSILGVTTPAGLSATLSNADWDNGLLPRFALLTPEPGYKERPALVESMPQPESVVAGLGELHNALPAPEKTGDGWKPAEALELRVECWPACMDYSNRLRKLCDPDLEMPLDDRLKGVYGRLHVQALKVAMICATLDWLRTSRKEPPVVTSAHWRTAQAVAEHWRHSARRLLGRLDHTGSVKREQQDQDRVLDAFRGAGPGGLPLRTVYRRLNLKAKDARQVAQDLVRAGLLHEISLEGAEGYRVSTDTTDSLTPPTHRHA